MGWFYRYHDTDKQFAAMAGAFAAGEADFTTAFEPTATQLEKDGSGYIVASIGKDSGKIPYTAYSSTKSYMKDNKEVLEKFTRAIYKAQQWCKDASDKEIAEAIQPYFEDNDIDELVTVAKQYRKIGAWCENPYFEKESLDNLMKVMETAGELEKEAPYDKIVDTSIAQKIIDEK